MTRKTMSDIAEQLRAKGFSQHTSQFQIATLKFFNAGGSRDEAIAVVDAVFTPIAVASVAPRPTAINTNPTPTDLSTFSGRDHLRRRRKMPGHAKRGAAVISAVQATLTRSLFDTYKLRDGRVLGEIRWCDVPALRTRFRDGADMDDRLLSACYNFGVPADPTVTLKVAVPEKVVAEIYAAKGSYDAD